jgi:stringent starvation protein B
MTPLKPYLIRAVYEWIVDNEFTPYLLVDATHPDAVLPEHFIEDGKIVLNIRPAAIHGLLLDNATIEFKARFSGRSMQIVVPVVAVMAIYAQENGRGMVFDPNDDTNNPPPPSQTPPPRPQLRIVK